MSESREGGRLDQALTDIRGILERLDDRSRPDGEPSPERQALDPELLRQDQQQDLKLKGRFAAWALVGMGFQLVAANVAFYWYCIRNGWDVPAGVIQAWLAATVVQVVAVVLVITRSLYPPKGR